MPPPFPTLANVTLKRLEQWVQTRDRLVVPYAATYTWYPGREPLVVMKPLTGNTTVTVVTVAGDEGVNAQMIFTQDGTGGRTVTFAGAISWGTAGFVAVGATANKSTLYQAHCFDAVTVFGWQAGKNF
jgi:hypothetical protein